MRHFRNAHVGAWRSLAEIKEDPEATAEEISRLEEEEQAAHPNCPAAEWWELAKDHPLDAMSNPTFALYQLESPGRWEQLESTQLSRWFGPSLSALPNLAWYSLAADCVERVLPFFEQVYPDETLPRDAIKAVRDFVQHEQLPMQLLEIAARTKRLADATAIPAMRSNEANQACNVAYAAWYATTNNPLWAADYSRSCLPIPTEKEEFRWQWHRLLGYWRGEL